MNIETKTKRKFVWIVGLACLFGVLAVTSAQAQVKVGTNPATIDARSILELESDNQALYLPRLSDLNLAAVNNWQEGMVVYNTDHDCIQIFNGTTWNCVDTDNDGIYDGSGTIPTTTIATITDNLDFVTGAVDGFAVDGTTFSVDGENNRVGVGTAAPLADLHIENAAGTLMFTHSNGNHRHVIHPFFHGTDPVDNRMLFGLGQGTNAPTDVMALTQSGRLGIGITSPLSTLHVQDPSAALMFTHSNGNHRHRISSSFHGTDATSNMMSFGLGRGTNAPTTVMTLSESGLLNLTGQIRIQGGTPGAGRVLTSDANGLATWENPAIATTQNFNGNDPTIAATTQFLIHTSATAHTVTLPAPGGANTGRVLHILNVDDATANGALTFATGSPQPVGPISSISSGFSASLISNGTNWLIYSF